jgi:hypothetical protein
MLFISGIQSKPCFWRNNGSSQRTPAGATATGCTLSLNLSLCPSTPSIILTWDSCVCARHQENNSKQNPAQS